MVKDSAYGQHWDERGSLWGHTQISYLLLSALESVTHIHAHTHMYTHMYKHTHTHSMGVTHILDCLSDWPGSKAKLLHLRWTPLHQPLPKWYLYHMTTHTMERTHNTRHYWGLFGITSALWRSPWPTVSRVGRPIHLSINKKRSSGRLWIYVAMPFKTHTHMYSHTWPTMDIHSSSSRHLQSSLHYSSWMYNTVTMCTTK